MLVEDSTTSYKEVVDKFVNDFGATIYTVSLKAKDRHGRSEAKFLKKEVNGEIEHARLPSLIDDQSLFPIDTLEFICARFDVPIKAFEAFHEEND